MILNGECGRFNPLLLDCLLAVKDQLYVKLHTTPTADASRTGAEQLSDRLLHEEELPYTSAMQYQLACERIKRDFTQSRRTAWFLTTTPQKARFPSAIIPPCRPYENQIADIDTLIRRRQISPMTRRS